MYDQPSHSKTVRPVSKEQVKSYLCGSAPVRKLLAEPEGIVLGGCSQGGPAMDRLEGASQQYFGGWRFGPTAARVSAPLAKRNRGSFPAVPCTDTRLRCRAVRVLRVATWRKRSILRTIEDPLCFRSGGITRPYKAPPKWVGHAVGRERCCLPSAFWGSQLNQSSRPPGRRKVVPQEARLGLVAEEQLARRLKPQSARGVPLHAPFRRHAKQHSALSGRFPSRAFGMQSDIKG